MINMGQAIGSNKLNWRRVLLGLLTGFIEFWLFGAAFMFAVRNGWFGPSKWYDGPVCAVLILAPAVFWLAWNIRAFLRSGNKLSVRLAHGVIYLSAMPAGFALTLLTMRGLF